MWDKIDAGDYDIAQGGWGPYYNEPSAFLQLFDPDNGYFNSAKTGWTNEESKQYKELLEKAKNIVDDKRKGRDLSGGGKSGCRKCIDCADLPGGITDLCEKLCEKLFCNDKWNSGFFTGID